MMFVLAALQVFLAVVVGAAGFAKLVGVEAVKEQFRRWGYSFWFRLFTGFYEVSAALLLVLGLWSPLLAAIGAGMLVISFIVATVTHYRVGDPTQSFVPAAVLWLMAVIVLAARWSTLTIS